MATLLDGVSANGAGSGASHSGPCTVIAHGDSVFDGATVSIEICDTDTAAEYAVVDGAVFRDKGAIAIDGQGSYYLRASVSGAGDNTSVTVVTTQ